MPFPLPSEGMTLHDVIQKFTDIKGRLSQKEFGILSDLCEAGEDKQKLMDIGKSQELY